MAELEREVLFQELRTLSDALDPALAEDELSFSFHGVTVSAAFCNGHVMLLLWDYKGLEPTTFPKHMHKGIIETIGLLRGGEFICETEKGTTVLSQPGDSIVVRADQPHQVFCKPEDGPCSGWVLLAPPEQNFVLREEKGTKKSQFCLLHRSGRCAASASAAAECIKRKLIPLE